MLFNAQPDGPDEGKAISGTARELCDDLTEMLSGVPWETQPQKTLSHQQLKEYVQTHLLDVDFSIATTAAAFGFSESAFSYQFKRIMRVNYLAYVNREKIQHAQRLLQCDANTIESIAARLGYANASNFSRMFKSITGMTPGQYRRSDAENPPPSNDDKGGPNNDNL